MHNRTYLMKKTLSTLLVNERGYAGVYPKACPGLAQSHSRKKYSPTSCGRIPERMGEATQGASSIGSVLTIGLYNTLSLFHV